MVNASIHPAQCRAARGLLDWSQDDLAKAAKVSRGTVKNLEAGVTVSKRFVQAVRAALEEAGIALIGEGSSFDGHPVSLGAAMRVASS